MEPNFNPYEPNSNTNHTPFPVAKKPANHFATASLILAGGAIFSFTFIYGAYILGALAILFALLSRGGQMKMDSKAKFGLALGVFAIIFSTVVTVGAFMFALEEFGSLENMLRNYCEMYGLDFEQEFGILFE